jgi:hypothetical protein
MVILSKGGLKKSNSNTLTSSLTSPSSFNFDNSYHLSNNTNHVSLPLSSWSLPSSSLITPPDGNSPNLRAIDHPYSPFSLVNNSTKKKKIKKNERVIEEDKEDGEIWSGDCSDGKDENNNNYSSDDDESDWEDGSVNLSDLKISEKADDDGSDGEWDGENEAEKDSAMEKAKILTENIQMEGGMSMVYDMYKWYLKDKKLEADVLKEMMKERFNFESTV